MSTAQGIPRHFRGINLAPYDGATREPADPPVRFIDRCGEGTEPTWANSKKTDSSEDSDCLKTGEHRVPPSRFDQGLIAPPSVDPDRLPEPFVADEGRPLTRGEARGTYRRIVSSNRATDGVSSKLDDARSRYARIRDGDRYLRTTMDGLTTVLLSLRLSPTDENGRVVTPWQLTEDLYAPLESVMGSLRYTLGKHGFEYEYVRVTSGTVGWSSPHLHLYCWVEDPHDAVDCEMFRSVVSKHVEKCPRASWQSHDVTEERTVVIEHDPLLATETDARDGGIGDLRDVMGTRGALYLGTQLPHMALIGEPEPWELDRAVTAWISSRRWFSPSADFPDEDDVERLKDTTE